MIEAIRCGGLSDRDVACIAAIRAVSDSAEYRYPEYAEEIPTWANLKGLAIKVCNRYWRVEVYDAGLVCVGSAPVRVVNG